MNKSRITPKFIWGLCLFLLVWAIIGGMILSRAAKDYAILSGTRSQVYAISQALKLYSAKTGSLPQGDNSFMFRSLAESNAIHAAFLPPGETNAFGEILDYWKTPFHIEPAGGTNFIVRSAGKNKTFGDDDDVVLAQPAK